MRVLRTILGLLLLIIGLPALLVGAGFWAAMQHRDPGGAFSGELQRTVTSGYAVVVTDADGLLRKDAPFARGGDTRLRLTASTLDGPAFIGIGPADEVARYLEDVPRQVVTTVDLGTGALPVATNRMGGTRAPASVPNRQSFWLKSATGGLSWHPSALRGRHYSVVIMNPSAQPGLEITAAAQLSPGWLNSATWSLLIFGSLLVIAGILILAWPGRRREVVYVVEPSQVPDLMVAIGAPLPLSRTGGGRHAGTHRPRTLADAGTKPGQRGLPSLAWPPSQSDTANAPVSPGIGAAPRHVAAVPPSSSEYAAATAIPGPGKGTGRRVPAPGEPLSLIGGVPSKGVPFSSSSPTSAPVADEVAGGRPVEPIGRRRALVPAGDTPVFEATAVGAWVAETAAARARETEARAAAVLAAEAAKHGAADGDAVKHAAANGAERGVAQGDAAKPGVETASATVTAVTAAGSVGLPSTGLKRADSPQPGTDDPAAATVNTGRTPVPGKAPAKAAATSSTMTKGVTPEEPPSPGGSAAERPRTATGNDETPAPAKAAPAIDERTATGSREPVTATSASQATPAQPSGPQSTAPAPARPAAPNRPTVPAPARPAPPPRPTPDPTPSRPAAEGPAVPQPTPATNPAVSVSQPAAKGAAVSQPAAAEVQSRPGASTGTTASGRQGAPVTQPKDGQSQAPVHVSISDRPAVVSQPGSSIPGATAEPAVGVAPRPAAEVPSTTTEIQARLQAAMKSSTRPSGEPRTGAPTGSPGVVPSANAAPSAGAVSSAAATPAGGTPSTDAVRVGVAGRRDYPAIARRDSADITRSGRTGRPTSTSATSGPVQAEREERGQTDAATPKAAENTVATKSGNHIAEQRIDSDQPRTDSVSTEAGGKAKTRRPGGKAAKTDRTKSAKPEAAAPSVPGARLSAYAEEAAELLAGLSPDRRRRKQDGAAGPTEESPSTRNEPAND